MPRPALRRPQWLLRLNQSPSLDLCSVKESRATLIDDPTSTLSLLDEIRMSDPRYTILGKIKYWLAKIIVNREYYLLNYPDVAAAQVEPAHHYAAHWRSSPIRAPNVTISRILFTISPFVVQWLVARGQINNDWLAIFKIRFEELCHGGRQLQYRIAVNAVRKITAEPFQNNVRVADYFGQRLPVFRAWKDDAPWLVRTQVKAEANYTFYQVRPFNSKKELRKRQVVLPALTHATINNATIFGTAQILAGKSFVIEEPAADTKFSFVAGQQNVIQNFDQTGASVIAKIPSVTRSIPEGILLGGRCAKNYFHFIIEYLTKGFVFEDRGLIGDIPLIVTDDLFASQYEAIELIFPDSPVLRRPPNTAIEVDLLHTASIMTYLPDASEVQDWSKAGIRGASLDWLRSRVLANTPPLTTCRTGGRYYLTRRLGRSITNAPEIEDMFVQRNFEIIDPASMSFVEQVNLFQSADCIAGPTGAAFANTIFCKPGTKVIGLSSRHSMMSIFQNIAHFANCDYWQLSDAGPLIDSHESRLPTIREIHSSFSIDTDMLAQFLSYKLD